MPPAPPTVIPSAAPLRPGRRAGVAALAAAVLLLHGLLLGLLPRAPGSGWQAEGSRRLQLRHIAGSPPGSAEVTMLAMGAPQPHPRPAAPLTSRASKDHQARPARAPMRATEVARTPVEAISRIPPETVEAAKAVEATDEPGGVNVPVYATRLPPAVTLQYQLRRGRLYGHAELHWVPAATGYELTMRGQAAGAPLLGSTSVGRLDAHGIAPERQTEHRRGRELRAVNFQRDSARITFSGPQREYPLVPGTQDRLSWMLQLAGVLAADAALAEPGHQVQLFVSGPRGDAAVWVFEVASRETVDVPAGTVADAVHLRREPRGPYDTQVDVWLDPARHYLPARAHLLVGPTGDGTEFLLEGLVEPP